jgi:HEPN domain-containing protein
MDRSGDWLRQAERDLESARLILRGGFYEWACFISQQAPMEYFFQKDAQEAIHFATEITRFCSHKIAKQGNADTKAED